MRSMFRWVPRPPASAELLLVRRSFADGSMAESPSWVVEGVGCWVTYDGESVSRGERDEVIRSQIVTGGDVTSLDWRGTDIVGPAWRSGWLDPDGAWYGCAYAWHEAVCELVLRMTVREAEETHVRAHDRGHVRLPSAGATAKQRSWLSSHGYVVAGREAEREEAAAASAARARSLRRSGLRRDGD